MTRLSSRSRPAARPIWTFPKGTRHTGLFWDTLQVIDVKFEVVDDFVIFDINEQIPEINLLFAQINLQISSTALAPPGTVHLYSW